VRAPHRTLLGLALPVLVSLIAEPLTGLADTAFIAELGAAPEAALGVGTILLSAVFWIFNFLGISTQTEVARTLGAGEQGRARQIAGLALLVSALIGVGMLVLGVLLATPAAAAMEATGQVQADAVLYLRIRLLAAPAVLATTAIFGALRGLQDMRTPLKIAVAANLLNVALDRLLIFGAGPIPAYGIAGAAWATAGAQWLAAGWAVISLRRRLGIAHDFQREDVRRLFLVGRDMFVRTGLLTLFLLLATRSATAVGETAGAAHHGIRQFWLFTALVLDSFAAVAQSLVGWFLGTRRPDLARRVAAFTCWWSLGTGVAIAAGMILASGPLARLLVPPEAEAAFLAAWLAAALAQPLNALSFATDGIHWGTADFAFLRNSMIVATLAGVAGILAAEAWIARSDPDAGGALTAIWIATAVWITVRAAFGMLRVWPGFGAAPLARAPR